MHTPGPWRMGLDGDVAYIFSADHQRGYIARVFITDLRPGRSEENLANARMMTAGPDLLKACEGLLEALNIAFDRREGDLLGIHHNDAVDAIAKAESAIAKAKGLEP